MDGEGGGPSPPATSIWATPTVAQRGIYEEAREFDGLAFKVKRRALTYIEEARILAKVVDPRTKRADQLELLAHTFDLCVTENNFELTAKRIREDLKDRPAFAWFLINWLCGETLKNVQPEAAEELRKKSGP